MDKSGEKGLKIQEHKHKHKNTCTQAHGAHKHHFTQMSNMEDALTCKRTIPPTEQTFSLLVSTQYGVQENRRRSSKGQWCVLLQDSWWYFIHLRLGHPRPPPIFCPPALLLRHQRVTSPLWLIAPALHKLSHLALSRAQRHKHLLTQTHTKTERHRRCLIAALHQLAHPHPPNEPPINSVFSQLHCYKRHQIHKINLKQLPGKHFKIKPQVGGEILFSAPRPSSEWSSHVSSRTKSVLEESNVYGLRKR